MMQEFRPRKRKYRWLDRAAAVALALALLGAIYQLGAYVLMHY